jgi:hypothetical protein
MCGESFAERGCGDVLAGSQWTCQGRGTFTHRVRHGHFRNRCSFAEEARLGATLADDHPRYCRHIILCSMARFACGCSHVHHCSRTLSNCWRGFFPIALSRVVEHAVAASVCAPVSASGRRIRQVSHHVAPCSLPHRSLQLAAGWCYCLV